MTYVCSESVVVKLVVSMCQCFLLGRGANNLQVQSKLHEALTAHNDCHVPIFKSCLITKKLALVTWRLQPTSDIRSN